MQVQNYKVQDLRNHQVKKEHCQVRSPNVPLSFFPSLLRSNCFLTFESIISSLYFVVLPVLYESLNSVNLPAFKLFVESYALLLLLAIMFMSVIHFVDSTFSLVYIHCHKVTCDYTVCLPIFNPFYSC